MSEYVACPKCGGDRIKKVGYTWWGGFIGPRLFTHVKCIRCNTTYNGKTGKSNTTPIIIFSIIAVVIGIIIVIASEVYS